MDQSTPLTPGDRDRCKISYSYNVVDDDRHAPAASVHPLGARLTRPAGPRRRSTPAAIRRRPWPGAPRAQLLARSDVVQPVEQRRVLPRNLVVGPPSVDGMARHRRSSQVRRPGVNVSGRRPAGGRARSSGPRPGLHARQSIGQRPVLPLDLGDANVAERVMVRRAAAAHSDRLRRGGERALHRWFHGAAARGPGSADARAAS